MKLQQKEAWWLGIQRLDFTEDLNPKEVQDLGDLLRHPVMMKAFSILLRKVTHLAGSMLKADLNSPEGINNAIRAQSQASGIVRGIETLGELSVEEEKEDENGRE